MPEGIESSIGDVWQCKQSVAGTIERPDAAAMKHLRKVEDGALKAAKTLNSEEWADGRLWGSPTSYVDTIAGAVGSLTVQGQIEVAAFLWAQQLGSDIVTGASDPYTHTMSSGSARPALQTVRQKVGATVGPIRQAFYDARISKLVQNAGQDRKVLHLTEDLVALKAAQTFVTDPTAADSGVDPLNWNEAVTRLNGTAMPEIGGDMIEADLGLDVKRGQTASPVIFAYGKGAIRRTVETVVTDSTVPEIYNVLYGTRTPPDATPVTQTVVQIPISSVFTRSARRTLTIDTPLVEVTPDDWQFGVQAEGGVMPVAFGGRCKAGGSPALTVTALTGDSAAYV